MEILFNRNIKLKGRFEDEKIVVEGELTDTFHSMKARLHYAFPSLEIISVETELIKFPHEECLLYKENIAKIKGVKVNRNFYKSLMEKIGGPYGCAHINNLLYEMGMAAVQVRFAKFDELKPEGFDKIEKAKRIKLYLDFMPSMKNACSAWAEWSPMVKTAERLKEKY